MNFSLPCLGFHFTSLGIVILYFINKYYLFIIILFVLYVSQQELAPILILVRKRQAALTNNCYF